MRPAKYMPENTAKSTRSPKISSNLKIVDFLRAHWTALMFAFCAVVGETLTDVLEPWPVKIVVDDVLQNKRLPKWISRMVSSLFGEIQHAILNFAVGAAAAIAIRGALSSYLEKHLTTSVEPVGNARFATDTVQPQELHPLTATVQESR